MTKISRDSHQPERKSFSPLRHETVPNFVSHNLRSSTLVKPVKPGHGEANMRDALEPTSVTRTNGRVEKCLGPRFTGMAS